MSAGQRAAGAFRRAIELSGHCVERAEVQVRLQAL